MVQAQLRWLHSPDVFDLEHYIPEDSASFGFLLQAMIGPDDDVDAYESFDIMVCTPEWFRAALQRTGQRAAFGRHYLFLLSYDYVTLWQILQDLCQQAEGNDWEEVATFLSRYGKWEFEDYIDL